MDEASVEARLAAAAALDSKLFEAVLTAAEAMELASEDSSERLMDSADTEVLRMDLMD